MVFKIIGDNEQFDKAVKESSAYLDDFKQKTGQANEIIGKAAREMAVLTSAVGAMGAATVKMATDYNAGFAQVYTLLDEGEDRLNELQADVLNLSPVVGKTTDDLTSGLYDVISAFGDTAESAQNLELAAKAATAGNATTQDSVALLSAVTKAYGDTSNEAQQKVANNAFMAVKLGQTTFPELASSIQSVTSQSQVLGVSQEELFAVFSSGTGVIGNAAEVSTKYSAVLTELQKPGDRLASAFDRLGAATGQELIANFGGLSGAMQALQTVADETGEPISNLFGSAEAGKLALHAAGEGAEKFARDLQLIQESAGALDTAFARATTEGPNAFGFQLQQAGLNAKAFAISLGQELIPSVQTLLNPVFRLAEILANLNEGQLKAIASIGKVALSALAATTAIFGLAKGVLGAKRAFDTVNEALKITNAAFKANHLGLFVAGVTAAIVALKELADWIDYVRHKKHELELESLEVESASEREAVALLGLADQYDSLRSKTELTAQEELQLQRIREELIALNPELAESLSLERDGYATSLQALQNYNTEKQQELQNDIAQTELLRDEHLANVERYRAELEAMPPVTASSGLNLRGSELLTNEHRRLEEELAREEELLNQAEDSLRRKEDIFAQLQDWHGQGLAPEAVDIAIDVQSSGEEGQAERLAEIDRTYSAEVEIIQNRNIDEREKNEALLNAESDYYQRRIELLEKFHTENLAKGLSYRQSELVQVGENHESILQETENTYREIDRLAEEHGTRESEIAEERHRAELEAINNQAEAARAQVAEEVRLRKSLGDFDGADDAETERNSQLYTAQKLRERQNELMEQYLVLQDSSNEKDKEKAAALWEQIKTLDGFADAAKNAADETGDAFATMSRKVADKIAEVGNTIKQTFDGIANIAKDIIKNQETRRKQETNKQLAALEREKNETLLAIDDELYEMREQKKIEAAEKEQERREAEYEKRLNDANRNIKALEKQLQAETNLEKIRNMEQQLEEARKKKAEETARKKEQKEKQQQEKEARKQEVELLNARAKAAHEFAVTKIQTENAAGDAAAKAAQEMAKWEKAQGIISMTIKAAIQIAEAAAAFPDPVGMAAHASAAVIAGVQASVIGAQPLPPDYIQQPLPPAPRLIKFALGGIVMPSAGGTGITLPGGSPGLVAEAGVPEMILPITPPNMESLFRAAGVTNNNSQSSSLTINPSYNINMTMDAGEEGLDEKILETLREHDRELINIAEEGRQKWFV